MAERISEPLGTQTSDVIEWSRSLRSRSPSPSRQNVRSRSPSPARATSERGAYLTDVQKSMPDFTFKKTKSTNKMNSMRKSTGSLAANFSTTTGKSKTNNLADLNNIEAEYIKNLQQQIYFLELESNYLDQAKKATEMHPKMTAEAERMLTKLRQMQLEIDSLQMEIKKKETVIAVTNTEKDQTFERLKDEEAARSRDKRNLMDEIIDLKKQKDVFERELNQKDSQLFDAKTELDKSATALKNAEIKIQTLRSQAHVKFSEPEGYEKKQCKWEADKCGKKSSLDVNSYSKTSSFDANSYGRISFDVKYGNKYVGVDSYGKTSSIDVDRISYGKASVDKNNYEKKYMSDGDEIDTVTKINLPPLDQRGEQHNLTQITLDEKRSELLSVQTQLRELEDKYYSNTLQIQDKVANDLKEEIRLLRQKLKETEMTAEHDRYMKSKLTEDNANLVRENAGLNQQVLDVRNEVERERSVRETTESRHTQSHGELLQLRDKEKDARFEINHLQDQLKKEQEKCRHYLENLTQTESTSTSQELQVKTLKSRVSELESFQHTVERECEQLRKDKLLLVDHVSELQRKLDSKDQEVVLLRSQLQTLDGKVRDVERMNMMESSIQSQKWEEFEKLAESMRSLSHTMSQTGASTTRIQQY